MCSGTQALWQAGPRLGRPVVDSILSRLKLLAGHAEAGSLRGTRLCYAMSTLASIHAMSSAGLAPPVVQPTLSRFFQSLRAPDVEVAVRGCPPALSLAMSRALNMASSVGCTSGDGFGAEALGSMTLAGWERLASEEGGAENGEVKGEESTMDRSGWDAWGQALLRLER